MGKSIDVLLKELEQKKKDLRAAKKQQRKEERDARRAERKKTRELHQKSRKALGSLIRDFVRKPTDQNHKDVLAAMKEWKKLKS